MSAQFGLASGLLGFAKNCINLGAYQWGATILKVPFLQFFLSSCPFYHWYLLKVESTIFAILRKAY